MKKQERIEFKHKVVVLGIDALSPKIMDRLMAEGRLPHFQQLKDHGSYSPLKTVNPPQSPVAWASFATGRNPGKHGIFDFIKRDPANYKIELALSHIDQGKAKPVVHGKRFWQYLSEKKIPVTVISCPMTFPPDKVFGKMLSGMGVPDILGTEGTFSFIASERSPIFGNLTGPKVETFKGVVNVKVPFKAEVGRDQVILKYQGNEVLLKVGEWSGWQEVVFDLGWFRKAKGIFKFYLVETSPKCKLYISPINMDPRDPSFPIAYPKHYSKLLAEESGLFYTRGMPFDMWGLNEGHLDEKAFLMQVEDNFSQKSALLDKELSDFDSGVFYFYFGAVDVIQHMFWRYIDEGHPLYEEDAPAEYREMINRWYERMDEVVGRVMGSLGENDTLIILSDHGFGTFRRSANINNWLREHGYLYLKDQEALRGDPLLSDIDWSKTKAYAIGFNSIYLNVAGREAEGIVKPGKEMEDLKDDIMRNMRLWKDPLSDEPVINDIYERDEVFWGDQISQAPDLLMGFNEGYGASTRTAIGAVAFRLLEDNLKKWSGSHLFDAALVDGVIFSNRKMTGDAPGIIDLAPSILKLTGFSEDMIAEFDFDGRALF
ncbi:MAG: alkaline phosphatase family protein [Candidatus Omnitrophota bacterium]